MIKIIEEIAPRENEYFVAVSMGVDSLSALFWLKSKGYQVTPLHFHHNLRPQNDEMLQRFLELCKEFNLDGRYETGYNLKTESQCREARLSFYSRAAKNGKIITAHHLDDWIEAYLLNCFRGHPDHTPIPLTSNFEDFCLIHPFLLSTKNDFQQYLRRNGWIKYVVEDESNKVIKGSRRNWVRHAIIPSMAEQKLSLVRFATKKIQTLLLENCPIKSI